MPGVEFELIASWPVELMLTVVPAESVPAATALATAVESWETVSPAVAVKTKVLPVDASLMLVTEPAVSGVVALRGAAVVPVNEV